ncbi:hypothetical protein AMTRI_Chr08g207780 [Amborella trichopoda]
MKSQGEGSWDNPKFSYMGSCSVPDIWTWINSLPQSPQWETDSLSISICSPKPNQPALKFSIKKHPLLSNSVVFSLLIDLRFPIILWSSNPCELNPQTLKPYQQTTFSLFLNFITHVLHYSSNTKPSPTIVNVHITPKDPKFPEFFNLCFASMSLCVCIYEAPQDIRNICLRTFQRHLTHNKSKQTQKHFLQAIGSNLEEQWMRSLALAITNIGPGIALELGPYSYATPIFGAWKLRLYCPIAAMKQVGESSGECSTDDRLLFSLRHHHLETVLQLRYSLAFQHNWVDVFMSIDNIRCDIVPLVTDALVERRGAGEEEKHFPSRISLYVTPIDDANLLSVSVFKSSDNPTHEIGTERGIETGFDAPQSYFGVKVSATDSNSMSMKPWRFEQSAEGSSGTMSWFLHDSMDGREVFSSRPSKMTLIQPKVWFRDRYSNAYRPFTKQGGVVFARDEYGEGIAWRLRKEVKGMLTNWEIKGSVYVTYWPNKYRTFFCETKFVEFQEIVQLGLVEKSFCEPSMAKEGTGLSR